MSDVDELDELDKLDEFNTLIDTCQKIHNASNELIGSMNRVKQYFDKQYSINVIYNGITKDFNELLDEFHTQSLENIRTTGKSNFGALLMSIAFF